MSRCSILRRSASLIADYLEAKMPILNVSVSGRPDPAMSAHIAKALSETTEAHLRKDPAVTAVTVQYLSPESWIIGGRSLANLDMKSFWLEIKITAGTNTKTEIAAFVAAAFSTMRRLLGVLHEVSYIVVHEVPAASWGYAGETQEYRFISGKVGKAP
jgi:4-oxalocrotonate tautomerase